MKAETVEQIETVLANLTVKRTRLPERGNELATIRAGHAYAALADNDEKARAKLDKLNLEAATHQSEVAAIDAALKTAQQKLEAAKQREAKQVDREQTQALRAELRRFEACAARLDWLTSESASRSHVRFRG